MYLPLKQSVNTSIICTTNKLFSHIKIINKAVGQSPNHSGNRVINKPGN